MSLYLMPMYVFPGLKKEFDAAAGALKCGKSCINFTRVDELPLDAIGEIVAAHDAPAYRAQVQQVRAGSKRTRTAKSAKASGPKKRSRRAR
jgi:hypothetical protein